MPKPYRILKPTRDRTRGQDLGRVHDGRFVTARWRGLCDTKQIPSPAQKHTPSESLLGQEMTSKRSRRKARFAGPKSADRNYRGKGFSSTLPDPLKANVERASGVAMADVTVHNNSTKPSVVDAVAYTQGTHIHVALGQQRHLAHEAWHVVQQKQNRVQPTTTQAGVPMNASSRLEQEASVMSSLLTGPGRRERNHALPEGSNAVGPLLVANGTPRAGTDQSRIRPSHNVLQRQVDSFNVAKKRFTPPVQDLKDEIDYSYFTNPKKYAERKISMLPNPKRSVTDVPAMIKAVIDYGGTAPKRKTHKSGVVGQIGKAEFALRSGRIEEVFEGGHLIPHELWDKHDSDVDSADDYVNLVPMSRTMNVGASETWRNVEKAMIKSVNNLTGNDVLAVKIAVDHNSYYPLNYGTIARLFGLTLNPAKSKDDYVKLYNWIPPKLAVTGKEGTKTKTTVLTMTAVENEIHNFSPINTSKQLVQSLQRTPIWLRMSSTLRAKVGKIK